MPLSSDAQSYRRPHALADGLQRQRTAREPPNRIHVVDPRVSAGGFLLNHTLPDSQGQSCGCDWEGRVLTVTVPWCVVRASSLEVFGRLDCLQGLCWSTRFQQDPVVSVPLRQLTDCLGVFSRVHTDGDAQRWSDGSGSPPPHRQLVINASESVLSVPDRLLGRDRSPRRPSPRAITATSADRRFGSSSPIRALHPTRSRSPGALGHRSWYPDAAAKEDEAAVIFARAQDLSRVPGERRSVKRDEHQTGFAARDQQPRIVQPKPGAVLPTYNVNNGEIPEQTRTGRDQSMRRILVSE